jgi:hypothetical protein
VDHRRVAADEGLEGGLVALLDEVFQEPGVRQVRATAAQDRVGYDGGYPGK